MRISLIKSNIDDYKLRTFIAKDIWTDEICRAALSDAYDGEDHIEIVYSIVLSALLSDMEEVDISTQEGRTRVKNAKRLLGRFSKLLYGCSSYWAKGTEYESEYIERESVRIKKEENREQLQCLYEKLNTEVRPKNDILKLLTSDLEISDAILENKDAITTRKDLYIIIEPILLIRHQSDCFRSKEIRIARTLSSFCFKNANAFFERNGLEPLYLKKAEAEAANKADAETNNESLLIE